MIRIAIDTIVTRPPFKLRGLFEYTRMILKGLRELAPEYGVTITSYVGTNFSPLIAGLHSSQGFRTVCAPAMDRLRLWRYGLGAYLAQRDGHDLLFTTHAETVSPFGFPFVLMLHDVDFLRFRQYDLIYTVRLYFLFWLSARTARFILTNSQCSRGDIVKYLFVHPSKVKVVYLGCRHDLYNQIPAPSRLDVLRDRYSLDKPYIIHHGTIQPRKNLVRLMRAYQAVIHRGSVSDVDLVIAGNYGWNCDDVLSFAESVNSPARVVLTGFLDEEDLAALLKGACLAVIPSLWEGFCFPMVEAMACGVPTIASNCSCLPEISAGVLKYFNPESVDDIASAIEAVLLDSGLRHQLSVAGVERAASFTWDRCARQTLDALISSVDPISASYSSLSE